MKEAKKGKCGKCGKYFYIHEHHILPRAVFGEKGKTEKLCPNCHTHFHEYAKKEIKDPKDANEMLKTWEVWLKAVSVTVTFVVGLFISFFR